MTIQAGANPRVVMPCTKHAERLLVQLCGYASAARDALNEIANELRAKASK